MLRGLRPLEDAVEEVKRSTRRYAKRQMTWFRADARIVWLDAEDADPARLADQVEAMLVSGD